MNNMTKWPKVAYITSSELIHASDRLPKVRNRASIVHALISAYDLCEKMMMVEPYRCSEKQLHSFHSAEYIECLKNCSNCEIENDENKENDPSQYGLEYDCPVFRSLFDTVQLIAGSTLKACELIVKNQCDIAINWNGGWHHGHRDEAAGFCYVNDIVIGILKLKEKYKRILYIDIDIHHGDGVEEAFLHTDKVFTLSFHKFEDGFFPGTGGIESTGTGRERNHSINVPLKDGTNDIEFSAMFNSVLEKVKSSYSPDVIICQCGADGLTGDPMGGFNMTPSGISSCIRTLVTFKLPMVLLGGGGYAIANTARCWTQLTADAIGITLDNNIPEHKYLMLYGPGFELNVTAGNKRSGNNNEYLDQIKLKISGFLEKCTRHPLSEIRKQNGQIDSTFGLKNASSKHSTKKRFSKSKLRCPLNEKRIATWDFMD